MRASIIAEEYNVPSASIISTGFVEQARNVAHAQGLSNLAIAEYPGVVMTDSDETFKNKVEEILTNNIIEALTSQTSATTYANEPDNEDIVYSGTLTEVNDYFHERLWTDGLPVIPPTIDKIQEFFIYAHRSPNDLLGVLPPENRESTVWNIAVNGLMAGCRPEYMPVLIALAEVLVDPRFRIGDAGSTPGWEPLIILNGPIIKQLGFNYESGVMRVGRQSNTSIGRFLRLYMRNVAGLRSPPGNTDKGSFAYTFNVVLAENEDAIIDLGWQPFSVDQGFSVGENVVTVQSVVFTSPPTYSGGGNALDHLETIAEIIGRRSIGSWTAAIVRRGKYYPLLAISPSVAKVLAKDGWNKDMVKQYLYDNARIPADLVEKLARQGGATDFNLCVAVEEGILPNEYCKSKSPDRMVPVLPDPKCMGIVVSGDPGRNQSKAYIQNHMQGPPTSKRIEVPTNWETSLEQLYKMKYTGRFPKKE